MVLPVRIHEFRLNQRERKAARSVWPALTAQRLDRAAHGIVLGPAISPCNLRFPASLPACTRASARLDTELTLSIHRFGCREDDGMSGLTFHFNADAISGVTWMKQQRRGARCNFTTWIVMLTMKFAARMAIHERARSGATLTASNCLTTRNSGRRLRMTTVCNEILPIFHNALCFHLRTMARRFSEQASSGERLDIYG